VTTFGWVLVFGGIAALSYTCVGYPFLMRLLGRASRGTDSESDPQDWPQVDLVVTLRNEAGQVRDLIRNLLEIDYPAGRLRLLLISDASEDGTDAIVGRYEGPGLTLIRVPHRSGKTAAESWATPLKRGSVVVYADASSRVAPRSVKALVRALLRPGVGCASGVDRIVRADAGSGPGEDAYVSREMSLRESESRFRGLTGASGCLYAVRSELSSLPVEPWADRDFAMVLDAAQRGYKAVSVQEATCYLPPVRSLPTEYRRKVRTMVGGMHTLWSRRQVLNPVRYGAFAWMLLSHKVCRWLLPWMGLSVLIGATIATGSPWLAAVALGGLLLSCLPLGFGDRVQFPRPCLLAAYVATVLVAAAHASLLAVVGRRRESWEPIRTPQVTSPSPAD
jgi:cellulose synthase/poly-beta-1,6-N-acetylglucosamine synthase-like glycosyltransferase